MVLSLLAPETFGLSVAEAFACATPAIVRDAGGSRELLDATDGAIVYRMDAELLLALHRVEGDAGLRAQFARRARAGLEKLYTQQRHVDGDRACINNVRRSQGTAVH